MIGQPIRRCFHGGRSKLRSVSATVQKGIKLPSDPTSAVYRGRLFEWHTLQAFELLGMRLQHIGGKSDGGIDLKGEWSLLSDSNASDDDNKDEMSKIIPVVVQCKNVKNGCTPDHLRGLLGATVGLNIERKTLGILVSASPKPFTADTMALFGASSIPLGLARVCDATLQALVLNYVAQRWLDIEIHPRFDSLGKVLSPPLMITGDGRVVQHNLPTSSISGPSSSCPDS